MERSSETKQGAQEGLQFAVFARSGCQVAATQRRGGACSIENPDMTASARREPWRQFKEEQSEHD
eukprot:3912297-Prymnesium_polylepis.2